jgi:hypothetical protein
VTLQNCAGIFQCPPAAVNTTLRDAFEAELAVELERFCAGTCRAGGSCAYSYSGAVECLNGRCLSVANDAGSY